MWVTYLAGSPKFMPAARRIAFIAILKDLRKPFFFSGPRKMEFQIIAALMSLVSVVIAVGVMWGRLRRTVDGHDELLEKLSGMKLLTEEAYDVRNRENTVRLDNLSAIVDLMRQTLENEREALKACQLANAEILARFNQHATP